MSEHGVRAESSATQREDQAISDDADTASGQAHALRDAVARTHPAEQVENDIMADVNGHREHTIRPALDELRDLAADLEAASDDIDGLREKTASLEAKLESLAGLAEGETGGPAKRAMDLRLALKRRAESQTGSTAGKVVMHYADVQNLFADLGYGEVKKPECYRAMKDAADGVTEDDSGVPGIEVEDGIATKNGQDVRGVRLRLDALPEHGLSSGATTGDGEETEQHANHTTPNQSTTKHNE